MHVRLEQQYHAGSSAWAGLTFWRAAAALATFCSKRDCADRAKVALDGTRRSGTRLEWSPLRHERLSDRRRDHPTPLPRSRSVPPRTNARLLRRVAGNGPAHARLL